jgi:hypothetical protein
MREFGETKGALMDAAERDLSREERLFKALLREPARLQSQLVTAEHPRRLGLRLEIQACEMLLGQLKPILASSGGARGFPFAAVKSSLDQCRQARKVLKNGPRRPPG